MPFNGNINVYKRNNLHFLLVLIIYEILTFQMFDLENIGHVDEYNIHSDAILWQILSIKAIARIFMLALTVSEILRIKMFDLANLGQDYGLQHSH